MALSLFDAIQSGLNWSAHFSHTASVKQGIKFDRYIFTTYILFYNTKHREQAVVSFWLLTFIFTGNIVRLRLLFTHVLPYKLAFEMKEKTDGYQEGVQQDKQGRANDY
jgi:hypothetical protein